MAGGNSTHASEKLLQNFKSNYSSPKPKPITSHFDDKTIFNALKLKFAAQVKTNLEQTFMTGKSRYIPGQVDGYTTRTMDKDFIFKGIEKATFQQHLDVEQIISMRCNVSVCYKMHDKRFLIKHIPTEVV